MVHIIKKKKLKNYQIEKNFNLMKLIVKKNYYSSVSNILKKIDDEKFKNKLKLKIKLEDYLNYGINMKKEILFYENNKKDFFI